jgi:hypothetical protein
MPEFRFNARIVENREVFVQADTAAEAMAVARRWSTHDATLPSDRVVVCDPYLEGDHPLSMRITIRPLGKTE